MSHAWPLAYSDDADAGSTAGPRADTLALACHVAGIGVAEWDVATHVGRITPRAAEIFGLPADSSVMTRDGWLSIVHPEDRPRADRHSRDALAGSHPYHVEYRIVRPSDGAVRHVHVRGVYQLDAAGRPRQLITLQQDVTDEREREAILSAREDAARTELDELEALYRHAPIGLCQLDADLRFVRVNDTMVRMDGRPAGLHVGRYVFEVLPELEASFRQPLEHVLQTGEILRDLPFSTTSPVTGEPFHSVTHLAPVFGPGGVVSGVSVVALDVTEFRATQESRDLLTRELVHRIKNLFALVGSLAAMSAREAETIDDLVGLLRERLDALGRAHDLVRPVAPGAPTARTSLHTLVGTLLEPYDRGTWTLRGEDVEIGPAAASALALIIHEFATNAMKYGGLKRAGGSIRIETARHGETVNIQWREHGPDRPSPPTSTQSGFGSVLVRRSIEGQLRGTMHVSWMDDGLSIQLIVPTTRLDA